MAEWGTAVPPPVCQGARYHRPKPGKPEQHHIWPKSWGGPHPLTPATWNIVWVYLCGNCHGSVHELLRAYHKWDDWNGCPPPWSERLRYPRRVRALAKQGFDKWVEAGRPPIKEGG